MQAASMIGPALGLFTNEPHDHGFFSVFRKSGQGAAAGVIGVNGVNGVAAIGETATANLPRIDFSTWEGVLASLFNGTFNAPLQVMAALILFLSAGRCVARIVGLGAVLIGFVAYSQGVRWEDVYPLLSTLGARFSAAFCAFMETPA
jgi:hypothetical protein